LVLLHETIYSNNYYNNTESNISDNQVTFNDGNDVPTRQMQPKNQFVPEFTDEDSDEDEHVDYDDYDFPTHESEVFQDSRNSGNEGVPHQIETNNQIVPVPTDELVVYDHGNDDDLPILELTDESEDFQGMIRAIQQTDTNLFTTLGLVGNNQNVSGVQYIPYINADMLQVFVLRQYNLVPTQGLVEIEYVDIDIQPTTQQLQITDIALNAIPDTTYAHEQSVTSIQDTTHAHEETEEEDEQLSYCS
jgi:hypothetical protein